MRQIATFLLIVLLSSCQDVKRPEAPKNLIPEDKMAEVLTEVYFINAARSFNNRIILENKMKLDSFFYRKFGIDSLQFVESNAYYTSNLNAYNRLFTKVEERMTLLKVETDSLLLKHVLEMEEKRIRDSIAEAKGDTIIVKKKDTLKDTLLVTKKDSLKIKPGLIDPKTMQ